MEIHTGLHRRPRATHLVMLLLLGLIACEDEARSDGSAEAVCPTCETRAGGETADFGAAPTGPAAGSQRCDTVEAPLTDTLEEAFELAQLRTFLATPHVVEAEPSAAPGQPPSDGPVEIRIQVELGDFTFYRGVEAPGADPDCDSVWAPVELSVEVGDGLLSLSAQGSLWKEEGHPAAHLHASADLASATGSYAPTLDGGRPHAGKVELSMYVFPDQLRGALNTAALYFVDAAQAEQYLEGDSWAYEDFESLLQLRFPIDDCEDNELPLAPDDAISQLDGRSAESLRREALELLEANAQVDAVWRDDSETSVSVELMESTLGSICAESVRAQPDSLFSGRELSLQMPLDATLRSADGRIELALDQLRLTVGAQDAKLRTATLSGRQPHSAGEQLDGWITYAFQDDAINAEGIVYIQQEVENHPGSYDWNDCMAFPPGGESDTGECRYMR